MKVFLFINNRKDLRDLILSKMLSQISLDVTIVSQNDKLKEEIMSRTQRPFMLIPDFLKISKTIAIFLSCTLLWRNRMRSQSHFIRAERLFGQRKNRKRYVSANNGIEVPASPFKSTLIRFFSNKPLFDLVRVAFSITSFFESRRFSISGGLCVSPYLGELSGRFDLLLSILQRRKNVTVAYQSNWDNLSSKSFIFTSPEYFGVWSEQAVYHLATIQRIDECEVKIVGSPRFAKHREIRELAQNGKVKSSGFKKTIIFASNGMSCETDKAILMALGELPVDEYKVVYRPHPFARDPLRNPAVHFLSENSLEILSSVDAASDESFIETLSKCDLLISQLSTLCLEARFLGIPVVLPLWSQEKYAIDFKTAFNQLSHFVGFQVLDGVFQVTSIAELTEFIKSHLYIAELPSKGIEWFCSSKDFSVELNHLLMKILRLNSQIAD